MEKKAVGGWLVCGGHVVEGMVSIVLCGVDDRPECPVISCVRVDNDWTMSGQ